MDDRVGHSQVLRDSGLAAGEIDDLAYLEIIWVHPWVSSLDGGWSCPISISDDPEGITRFNCDLISTCHARVFRNDWDYEEPTRCQSKDES